MAEPFLSNRGIVASKIEATKGTLETLADVDGRTLVSGLTPPRINASIIPREQVSQAFSQPGHLVGNVPVEFSFNAEWKGESAAGQVPDYDVLMRACGVAATVGADVQYDPITDEAVQETATIAYFADGKIYRMVGCMGDGRVIFRQNEKPRIEFSFQGVYSPSVDGAILTPSFRPIKPPSPRGAATFAWKSQTLVCTGFEFAFGNRIEPVEDITAPYGISYFLKTMAEPTISVDPQDFLVATLDLDQFFVDGTPGQFQCIAGTVGGNQFTLTAPTAEIMEAPIGDRTGKLIRNLVLGLRDPTNSNAEWNITWD